MSKSRIVVRRQAGGLPNLAPGTVVEFPFTDTRPSSSGRTFQAINTCIRTLEALTPHERDVALMNLCSVYGEER